MDKTRKSKIYSQKSYLEAYFSMRQMFEFFKYVNGSFFSKSKYMNGVGFQILAYKSIPKSPVDTPPPPEA